MMDNTQIIAIDHGWSQIKTPHQTFTTGVKKLRSMPSFPNRVLQYNGEIYKIGSERMEVQENKVATEEFYILTLAAIAEELKVKGITEANIIIAAGLPLTRFGEEKEDFIRYLKRNEEIDFIYEEKHYHCKIKRVSVFPQCYAAVVDLIPTFKRREVVVDIGSWTIDILPVIDKKPDDTLGATLPQGLITCMRDINKKIAAKYGYEIHEDEISALIEGKEHSIQPEQLAFVEEELKDYAEMVIRSLTEMKINVKTTPIIFVGGGASVMKHYGPKMGSNVSYRLDVQANARGYERLTKIALASGR